MKGRTLTVPQDQPIIIEGKNCYPIKKDQLKLYEATSNTHGIERLITNKRKTNIPKQPNKHQTIIVYRDCNTEKLFIPKKYALIHDTERKIIMNKECFEITTSRLESIYNIKFIIDYKDSKRLTALSTVNPYSSKILAPGAEAPQVSIVRVLPWRPTYLPQPKLEPASIAKRFVTLDGRMLSL